jgi:hypothetical protein
MGLSLPVLLRCEGSECNSCAIPATLHTIEPSSRLLVELSLHAMAHKAPRSPAGLPSHVETAATKFPCISKSGARGWKGESLEATIQERSRRANGGTDIESYALGVLIAAGCRFRSAGLAGQWIDGPPVAQSRVGKSCHNGRYPRSSPITLDYSSTQCH